MAAKKKNIDWEAIEPAWRAGIKSVMQIADDYYQATGQTISHTAINKHFKALGVPRDLSAKIRAKAEAMVSASIVSGIVSTETTATDAKIITENAMVVANVELSQRRDIQRARSLAMSLLSELEATTDNAELFQELGLMLRSEDKQGNDRRTDLYHKVISLSGRVTNVKQLSDTLKTLVGLERQAFNMNEDGADSPTDGIRKLLKEIDGSTVSLLP
jgi:hypothetical protein